MTDIITAGRGALLPSGDMLETIEHELARSGLAYHTRRGYLSALRDFEGWRAGRPMTKTALEEYKADLIGRGLKAGTVNHKLWAVRWWARRLADLAFESDSPDRERIMAQAERAATVEALTYTAELSGRYIPEGEVRALFAAALAQDGPAAQRDAAMLAVAFGAGLRRSEMCALELAHLSPLVDPPGYALSVEHGKGDKARTVELYGGPARHLADWLAVRGDEPGPLWYAIRKGGFIEVGHGIGPQAAYDRLRNLVTAAGIPAMSWHDARRTLATDLLAAGVDVLTVQKVLGHASSATTQKYDRRPAAARQRAMQKVARPYYGNRRGQP